MNKEGLLAYFPKLSPRRYRDMIAVFGSAESFWNSSFAQTKQVPWPADVVAEFMAWKKTVDEAAIELRLQNSGVACLPQSDPGYPPLLRQIYDPPPALFVRGTLTDARPHLAVVGTRKFSPYGKQIAAELTAALARRGLVIVSGLALGIDSIAHHSALSAGGTTIAVLGSGVDDASIYPSAHRGLAKKIIENGGALVSEYPPGFKPTQYSFPERNRISAGISLATLVIEAPERSGALITAAAALDSNREVFAVPHPLTAVSGGGANRLIQAGAKLIMSAADVLQALGLPDSAEPATNNQTEEASPLEATVLSSLTREPVLIDEIINKTGLPSAAVVGALTLLELKGVARHVGGAAYVRSCP